MMNYRSEENKIKEQLGDRPEKLYRYYVYSKGAVEIDTYDKQVALDGNKHIKGVFEAVIDNEEQIKEYTKTYSNLCGHLFNRWYDELRQEHSYLSVGVFRLVYAKSYEDGHAFGYDEVAIHMNDNVDFALKIIKTHMEHITGE